MAVIKRASIQNLKTSVDIVDVVSSVVTLKRAGSKFKGLSPFNAEKTPSFFVSPDKGLYKCFSSGKAGDVISFVMETERLGFTEAVETLARRFNVTLEYESGGLSHEERSLRQELMDIHEEAAEVYREAFLSASDSGRFIRDYWTRARRFSEAVAEDFKIGFAPPDGGGLLERLRKRAPSDEALRQCGLFFVRGNGQFVPRFRGRLMIPIRDQQGRVVAFTARQLTITPADDPAREAKYVNSPETPIFIKGQLLFNLDRARKEAGEGRPFLMVEGQLDAIRCWSEGLVTTIAPQGTGVTDTQLRLLRRHHAALECLLDGDRAGQQAALRLVPLALQEGIEVSFLPLADGEDPDQLVLEKGVDAIHELRTRRMSAMHFTVSALLPHPEAMSAQEIAAATREVFSIVHRNPSEVARVEYLGEVARLTGLSRQALEADFRHYSDVAARRAVASATVVRPEDETATETAPAQPDEFGSPERDLLLLMLHFEALGKPLSELVDHTWIDTSTSAGRLLNQFLNDFEHDVWPGAENLDDHLESDNDRGYIASLMFEAPEIDDPIKVANDGIRRIVSNFCAPKIRKIELEIAAKQRNFDDDLLSLLKRSEEFRRLKLNPPILHPLA